MQQHLDVIEDVTPQRFFPVVDLLNEVLWQKEHTKVCHKFLRFPYLSRKFNPNLSSSFLLIIDDVVASLSCTNV